MTANYLKAINSYSLILLEAAAVSLPAGPNTSSQGQDTRVRSPFHRGKPNDQQENN